MGWCGRIFFDVFACTAKISFERVVRGPPLRFCLKWNRSTQVYLLNSPPFCEMVPYDDEEPLVQQIVFFDCLPFILGHLYQYTNCGNATIQLFSQRQNTQDNSPSQYPRGLTNETPEFRSAVLQRRAERIAEEGSLICGGGVSLWAVRYVFHRRTQGNIINFSFWNHRDKTISPADKRLLPEPNAGRIPDRFLALFRCTCPWSKLAARVRSCTACSCLPLVFWAHRVNTSSRTLNNFLAAVSRVLRGERFAFDDEQSWAW